MSIIDATQPTENIFKPTVGEEFINWVEKYWGLQQKYEQHSIDPTEESMPYEFVKETFTRKIDEIIKDRLSI